MSFIFIAAANAVPKTWIGTSGDDWTNAASWSPAGAPGASDDVIFDGFSGTVVFTGHVTDLLSLTLQNSSTVTFQSATGYIFGSVTYPVLNIATGSKLNVRTTAITATGGGLNLNVSGSSVINGTLDLLSGNGTGTGTAAIGTRITLASGSLTINGTIRCGNELVTPPTTYSNANFITVVSGTLSFGPNAMANIERRTGVPSIPFAIWDATATLKIMGVEGTTVAAPTWAGTTPHELGNFIFDCPSLGPTSYTLNMTQGATVSRFKGKVEIRNTNSKAFSFSTSNSINQTIQFDDDLLVGIGAGNTVTDFRAINNATGGAAIVTWNCLKHIAITPAIDFTGSALSTHSINFTGTAPQNVTMTGGNKTNALATGGVLSLTVNNAGNGVTLTSNTGNLKNLTLTNGKLTLGNFNAVTGYNSGTVSGNTTNYVVTNGTGKLTIVNTPAATSTLFPVGISASSYDPVRVNPTNAADFSINVRDASAGFTNPEGNAALTCNREWDISSAGTPGNTLTEFEPDATTGGCPGTGTKVVGHYTGGVWTETTSAAGPNFSYAANFNSFSPFGVGVAGGFACSPANAGTVSGTSPLYPTAMATYTSNGDPGGLWSSTNTSVATVDPSTGLVTAVAAGNSDITYTVTNGCGTVSSFKTLTVSNTNTWTGASGSDWATASNWSLGVVPTATQDVVFNGFTGTVKFLSANTIAPCATITITNASDVIFEDQDNGADSIGQALSPTVLTINGNSALRSRTIGSNSLTGGVVINTTGASVIAAGSTFDMKSGTFNKIIMRGGTLDVNGTILCGNEVLAGGTSNSGFINRIAGTLNFGPGSLVEFNRTSGINSAMPLATWDATSTIRVINCTGTVGLTSWSAGTHSLGNIVIDASGMNISVYNLGFSSATALLVNEIKGDFTVLNANGKIITLAAITSAGNTQAQTINFRGNVSVSNAAVLRAFNYTGSGSGSGVATWNFEKNVTLPLVGISINSSTLHTMNFTGSTSQVLSLSGFETNGIFSLNVNNGGNGVVLNANTGNLKSITLTSGKLSLGNFNAVAGYNAGVVTGDATNYVLTNGAGVLTINNVTTGHTFPIGNAKYNPLIIENGSGHSWSAKASDGITPNAGFNTDKAVLVTWDITPSVNPPSAGADITFQFDETTQTGPLFNIATNIQAWRKPASNWIMSGSPAAASGSVGLRTVKISGLTEFSPYGLANTDGPLPVSLISFSGEKSNTDNILKWTTQAEVNSLGFEVQRSIDGVNFTVVSFVSTKAPGGNSNNVLNYTFTDSNPVGKKHYYRLRQVDIDGRNRLSSVVLIKGDKALALNISGVFPNPAISNVNIIINTPDSKAITLMVADANGRWVKLQNAKLESGSNTISLDVRKLSAGPYTVKAVCDAGCETATANFIKQ